MYYDRTAVATTDLSTTVVLARVIRNCLWLIPWSNSPPDAMLLLLPSHHRNTCCSRNVYWKKDTELTNGRKTHIERRSNILCWGLTLDRRRGTLCASASSRSTRRRATWPAASGWAASRTRRAAPRRRIECGCASMRTLYTG